LEGKKEKKTLKNGGKNHGTEGERVA